MLAPRWESSTWHATGARRPTSARACTPATAGSIGSTAAYFRAVTVRAEPRIVFRWLCQLKVAPYSYDWIDNLGRQSPRALTPGAEHLEVGQRVMTIFTLVELEQDRHLTMRLAGGLLFPEIALSYVVVPAEPGASRLIMKFVAQYPEGIGGALPALLVAVGRPGDGAAAATQLAGPRRADRQQRRQSRRVRK